MASLVAGIRDNDAFYKMQTVLRADGDAFALAKEFPQDVAEAGDVRAAVEKFKGRIGLVCYFDAAGFLTNGPGGAPASTVFYENGRQIAYAEKGHLNDTPDAFAITNYAPDGTRLASESRKGGVFIRAVPPEETKPSPAARARPTRRHFRI